MVQFNSEWLNAERNKSREKVTRNVTEHQDFAQRSKVFLQHEMKSQNQLHESTSVKVAKGLIVTKHWLKCFVSAGISNN